MAFTAPHNVLQVFGTTTSETEVDIWTFGLRFGEGDSLMGAPEGVFEGPEVADTLDAIQTDLTTWWNAISFCLPSAVKMTGFKFNAVDVAGRYINQEDTYVRDLATPLAGGGASMLPPQTAVAVTFRTAAARGLAARGRIYLPPLSAAYADAGGRVAQSVLDNVPTATATLLTNLSNWSGLDVTRDLGRVCVMSKVGAGATRRVNRVDMGDLFDTIRSRRSGFLEHRSPEVTVSS